MASILIVMHNLAYDHRGGACNWLGGGAYETKGATDGYVLLWLRSSNR
jgi:hypothetical protein